MFERLINKFSSINSIKINKKSNKKILLVDRGRFYQAYLSSTLAKSLNDKFNYEPIVLLDADIGKKLKFFYTNYLFIYKNNISNKKKWNSLVHRQFLSKANISRPLNLGLLY